MESLFDLFWSYVYQYGFMGAVFAFLLLIAVIVGLVRLLIDSLFGDSTDD